MDWWYVFEEELIYFINWGVFLGVIKFVYLNYSLVVRIFIELIIVFSCGCYVMVVYGVD